MSALFFAEIANIARRLNSKIAPGIVAAVATLESRAGASELAKRANNLFGIKAGGTWKGKTIEMQTREFYGGKFVTVKSKFRAYANRFDSVRDYLSLMNTTRYKAAQLAKDPAEQIKIIARSGYATDPGYIDKVLAVFKQFGGVVKAAAPGMGVYWFAIIGGIFFYLQSRKNGK